MLRINHQVLVRRSFIIIIWTDLLWISCKVEVMLDWFLLRRSFIIIIIL